MVIDKRGRGCPIYHGCASYLLGWPQCPGAAQPSVRERAAVRDLKLGRLPPCIRCGHPHQGPNEVCGTCDGLT